MISSRTNTVYTIKINTKTFHGRTHTYKGPHCEPSLGQDPEFKNQWFGLRLGLKLFFGLVVIPCVVSYHIIHLY